VITLRTAQAAATLMEMQQAIDKARPDLSRELGAMPMVDVLPVLCERLTLPPPEGTELLTAICGRIVAALERDGLSSPETP